ncbi:DeoR/GlpR family DNA-binding transcription regulator [Chitinimonas sp.]|uniref:DeoR/GlpR family DNA-binding transcription regulator n=1 Tax=Chitinimonas sp. TaxID=1934313 RepID=UPI0035B1DA7D
MLTEQRKAQILASLQQDGQVVAKALSARFGVSEDTIRRDLRELAAEGLLQRVHGGALPVSLADASLAKRQDIAIAGKHAVAAAAAAMVSDGQVVMIDGGTTAMLMAHYLPNTLAATVVTHSPHIAVALQHHLEVEVILIGGRLFKHSMVTVGAAATDAISHIRADTFFMGVTGVHASAGLSTGDLEEAYIKRALAAQAAETVVLASAEKLHVASRYKIGDIGMASSIIVDGDGSDLGALKSAGVDIVHA